MVVAEMLNKIDRLVAKQHRLKRRLNSAEAAALAAAKQFAYTIATLASLCPEDMRVIDGSAARLRFVTPSNRSANVYVYTFGYSVLAFDEHNLLNHPASIMHGCGNAIEVERRLIAWLCVGAGSFASVDKEGGGG